MGFGKSSSSSNQSSQSSSRSYNQAYPFISQALSGEVGRTSSANSAIADLLGLNGATGQNAGFQRFLDSSGYNFIREQGMNGIEGRKAAQGLLHSGSALTALSDYNSNLGKQYLNDYMSSLFNLSNSGLNAANVITNAGNTASSQGTSTGTSSSRSSNFSFG